MAKDPKPTKKAAAKKKPAAKKPAPKRAAKAKGDPELDKLVEQNAPAPASETPPVDAVQGAPDGAPMLSVLAQYLKDSSFENPGAPDSLRAGQAQPEVNIDLAIGRQVFDDNTLEVAIRLKAHATRGERTAFIAEIEYAGLFAIQNVGLEQMQPMMMIECPRVIFPYARKILADMTQDGGFPPVMLDMPDFAGMFRDEMMRRAQEAGLN